MLILILIVPGQILGQSETVRPPTIDLDYCPEAPGPLWRDPKLPQKAQDPLRSLRVVLNCGT